MREVVGRRYRKVLETGGPFPDLILIDDSLADIEAAETGRLITTCPVTAHIPIVRIAAGRRVPPRVFTRLRRAAG